MLTILIWLGSGFAFAVGIAVGVWMCRGDGAKQAAHAMATNSLLQERNKIGERQAAALERLAFGADFKPKEPTP